MSAGEACGPSSSSLGVLRPDLHVAGHRLAVKLQVVRDGAEQHVHQRRFLADQCQLVLVAQDFVPAVRPLVGVAQMSGRALIRGPIGIRLMEHAGLRDADPDRRFMTIHVGQERDLQCQRQLRSRHAGPVRRPRRPDSRETAGAPVGRQGILHAPAPAVAQIDETSPGISRLCWARRHETRTTSPTTAIRLRSKTGNPA